MEILRDQNMIKVAENVKPDAKKRVVIPGDLQQEGVLYHIYKNSAGQILLDPQVTIPASEAWLYHNPEALASVRRGLDDAVHGRVSKIDMNSL